MYLAALVLYAAVAMFNFPRPGSLGGCKISTETTMGRLKIFPLDFSLAMPAGELGLYRCCLH